VGSSTIANFVRDAEPVYGKARFVIDSAPESAGGELAILEGRADLAGVAGHPKPETLDQGVVATLIGRDTIAVVVNPDNPVSDLTKAQLKEIFTGRVRNWKALGGPDLSIRPFIVGPASATRKVFRSAILGEADYAGCEVTSPDAAILRKVETELGSIAQISASFLDPTRRVKAVSVDGQRALPTNPDYPIGRPLYLLWWSGRSRVADFISWVGTSEARGILLARFAVVEDASPARASAQPVIRYVGSSTVAVFMREAARIYARAHLEIDDEAESMGGERAIAAGTTDLAGTARRPPPEILRAGIASTLIGRDGIAVVANAANPVRNLSLAQLRAIFTGEVRNWKDLGGPDLPIEPLVVAPGSATREVFREVVLGNQDYAKTQQIAPDAQIIDAIGKRPGAVGAISFSFLKDRTDLRAIPVDGEEPTVTNFDYPIARPLYLLWRDGDPEVEAFVEWSESDEGQLVVMKNFVGTRVVGSVRGVSEPEQTGTLMVYTETYPVDDGGIFYYPHRPYELLTRHGKPIRRVQNHRGENDERPMRVDLAPGTYLIRPETARKERAEFFVTIEVGKTTEVDARELLRGRK
jgi:phosphate transport system substrate-binding protein